MPAASGMVYCKRIIFPDLTLVFLGKSVVEETGIFPVALKPPIITCAAMDCVIAKSS